MPSEQIAAVISTAAAALVIATAPMAAAQPSENCTT
jgi:hypothetical protein